MKFLLHGSIRSSMKKIIGFFILIWSLHLQAQVGIGTTAPDPSSILDITASNKGVLVPQVSLSNVTDTATPITSPATGLLIWNTNAAVTGGSGIGFYFFNGAQWIMISTSAASKGTLDESYDDGGPGAGRSILATDGPVVVGGEDGLEVTGSFGNGDAIANGSGARLYFNPNKAAFRAGSTTGGQWNNTNAGNYSVGFGNSTSAGGESSLVAGSFSTAPGRFSAALGRFAEASSYAEFAIGSYPTSYTPTGVTAFNLSDRSFVIGNATSSANRSNSFEVWKDGRVIINEAYTLPIADGTTGQVLQTDGSGIVAWSTVSGGSMVPTGAIFAFPTSTAPTGYLVCDGSAVSRTTYANLFALIGVSYGNGNGTTTFNLPDYRGQFLRGNDSGAGIDPDAGSRLDRGDGTTGDVVGSKQNGALGSHLHSVNPPSTNSNTTGNHLHSHSNLSGTTSSNGNHNHLTAVTNLTTDADGDHSHSNYYQEVEDVPFMGSGTDIQELSPFGPHDGSFNTSTDGSHTHTITIPSISTSSQGVHSHTWNTGTYNSLANGNHNHTTDIAAFNSATTGGNETRPTNVSVLWCIKY